MIQMQSLSYLFASFGRQINVKHTYAIMEVRVSFYLVFLQQIIRTSWPENVNKKGMLMLLMAFRPAVL